MTISVFTTIQVVAWVATLWKRRPVVTTAMEEHSFKNTDHFGEELKYFSDVKVIILASGH